VMDPGWQADHSENLRREERRYLAGKGLGRLAQRVRDEGDSFLLLLGNGNMQWWKVHLDHLQGEWWAHTPWGFTPHSRYDGRHHLGTKGEPCQETAEAARET